MDITLFYQTTVNSPNGYYYAPYLIQTPQTVDEWGELWETILKSIAQTGLGDAEPSEDEENHFVTLTGTTYKIYDTYIDIDTTLFNGNIRYALITYMIIKDTKYLCYHVTGYTKLPNILRLFVTPDYWGTYIGYAKFRDITLLRTTRNVGELTAYTPDDIPLTNTEIKSAKLVNYKFNSNAPLSSGGIGRADMRIYAVIRYEYGPSNNKKTGRDIYMFNPSEIMYPSSPSGQVITESDIRNAIGRVLGIYAPSSGSDYKATIEKVYLFDDSIQASTTAVKFTAWTSSSAQVQLNGYTVLAQAIDFKFYINHGNINFSTQLIGNTPIISVAPVSVSTGSQFGSKISVGTEYKQIYLPNFWGLRCVSFKIFPRNDEIIFTITSGEKSEDISSEFEISGAIINDNVTAIEGVQRAIQVGGAVASAGFQFAAGGAGYVSGALTLAQIPSMLKQQSQNNYEILPTGNAMITFNTLITTNKAYTILQIFQNGETTITESEYGMNGFGLFQPLELADEKYKNYIFSYLHSKPKLIDSGQYDFLSMSCKVSGVPQAACDEIREALSEGVRYFAFQY